MNKIWGPHVKPGDYTVLYNWNLWRENLSNVFTFNSSLDGGIFTMFIYISNQHNIHLKYFTVFQLHFRAKIEKLGGGVGNGFYIFISVSLKTQMEWTISQGKKLLFIHNKALSQL